MHIYIHIITYMYIYIYIYIYTILQQTYMLWAERSGFKQQTSVYEHNHDGCIKGISWNYEKRYLRTKLCFFVFPNAAIWL
jgi:hypothetical protein